MRMAFSIFFLVLSVSVCFGQEVDVAEFVKALKSTGKEPVEFVRQSLKTHDLIVFDDALHPAVEPFAFYRKLLRDPEIRKQAKYVFVEAFSLSAQEQIDAYLAAPVKDRSLLLKVFQDDFSGYGWRFETYMDLLETVWEINRELPESEKIRIIGVDQPVYWEAIHTRKDYDTFDDSLLVRDYFMYSVILRDMDRFEKAKKGFFLTNTRHSYKHLRKANGELFWNCETFFDQFHPGKTYSVRIHNLALEVVAKKESDGPRTAQGMENMTYRWARMANGVWDRAFAENGNVPVAISLEGNAFGRTPYVGNQMLEARKGQTMSDVHDALVFLAPLEELHFSAQVDWIYTDSFKKELKRRIVLLEGDHLPQMLKEEDAATVEEFIERMAAYVPQKKNSLVE